MSLKREGEFVRMVEEVHRGIEDGERVGHFINLELFYHAKKELPKDVPN